jgi:two-component system response regulator LytT
MTAPPASLRVLVVDDEPLARDELVFLLGQCPSVEVVGQAVDTRSAIELAAELEPDVAFVDLRMPGPDGIALAEALRARCPGTRVVVVSAHDEGAVRAFDASVSDYLLKPVRLERLAQTVERLRPRDRDAAPFERLAVKRKGVLVVVDVEDVLYFEMRDDLVWAVTRDDRFALDMTLADVEARASNKFFRSHRSCLVRISAIVAIEPAPGGGADIVVDHPEQPRLPLARERTRALKDIIPVLG